MSAEAPSGDVALWWRALGALGSACAAGFLFLWAYVQRALGERRAAQDRLWSRLNVQVDAAAEDRVEAARRFATKDDLRDLRHHIDRRFEEHERRMTDLVINRPPVRTS